MNKIGIYKCHPDATIPPKYGTQMSACFDLTVAFSKAKVYSKNFQKPTEIFASEVVIPPGGRAMVGTGIKMDIPEGYCVKLHVRSSAGIKQGLRLANVTGIIDADYVDEVKVALYNDTNLNQIVKSGDRLVQAELVEVIQSEFVELECPPDQKSSRVGGIGSTGGPEYKEEIKICY